MKNKKIMLLLTIMLSIFMMSGKVNALKIKQYIVKVDNGTYKVAKVYDNDAENGICPRVHSTNKNCVGASATERLEIILDDNSKLVGYCIEFGNALGLGSYDDGAEDDVKITTSLKTFLDESVSVSGLTSDQVAPTIKKLKYYYYFGYKPDDNDRNSPEYYLATQALIWQYLGSQGLYLRTPTAKMDSLASEDELRSNEVAGDDPAGEVTLINHDINPQKIRFLKGTWLQIVPKNLPDNPSFVTIEPIETEIEAAISHYELKPSFSNADKNKLASLEVGKTVVLTDEKGVLSEYTVTCSEEYVKCEKKSGNKLSVEAKKAGDFTITLKRPTVGFNNVDSNVYQLGSSSDPGQAVVVVGGNLPEMKTSLNGKVVEPQPGCYVCEDTGYQWGLPGDEGIDEAKCTLETSVHSKESCKDDLKCYKCKTDDKKFEYKWGELGKDDITEDKCTEQAEIDDATACKPACYLCGTDYIWSENAEEDDSAFEDCKVQPKITEEENCKYVPPVAPKTSVYVPPTPPTSGLRIAYISLICGIAAALGFVYFYSKKPDNE